MRDAIGAGRRAATRSAASLTARGEIVAEISAFARTKIMVQVRFEIPVKTKLGTGLLAQRMPKRRTQAHLSAASASVETHEVTSSNVDARLCRCSIARATHVRVTVRAAIWRRPPLLSLSIFIVAGVTAWTPAPTTAPVVCTAAPATAPVTPTAAPTVVYAAPSRHARQQRRRQQQQEKQLPIIW